MIKLFVLSLIIAATFSACQFDKNLRPLDELQRTGKIEEYKIGAGDVITIDVWGDSRLSGQRYVRDDGRLNMPLIGDIDVSDQTTAELEKLLTAKLADYIKAPSVSITIFKQAAIKYYLSGSFLTPGEYKSEGPITLLQAIASGGGFAVFANKSEIFLIRKATSGDYRYRLSYDKMVNGQQPNPELKNGDIIAVQ
ncbi:MAG: polysaccharide export protein [Deltaproteobacteria bacterium]|nr:polysaccharide export protein [Deltaproteobacteria bacterium]